MPPGSPGTFRRKSSSVDPPQFIVSEGQPSGPHHVPLAGSQSVDYPPSKPSTKPSSLSGGSIRRRSLGLVNALGKNLEELHKSQNQPSKMAAESSSSSSAVPPPAPAKWPNDKESYELKEVIGLSLCSFVIRISGFCCRFPCFANYLSALMNFNFSSQE